MSRNRLSEIPIEACHFVSLENLNLYQNCIRYIPEAILNLQALTFLNISRNQLSTLPVHLCNLPLKVLIAGNNKLVSLPEEIGHLRHLTELDVSCNEIQTIPSQIGNLEALRDLNIRRNHLIRLPEELAELPLIRLDFSCNKITAIPVCYRNLRHLQMITLDNNPLQSPPAQPTDEFSDLPLRVAEITKEQRLRRESQFQEHRSSLVMTNGGVEHDLDQIDYIDSCTAEEEDDEVRQPKALDSDSLSSQFMAYIEQRRITHELSHTDLELHRRKEQLVERTRREAQLAALQYEEEKIRTKQIQRDAVLDFVKCHFPSRRSQHTDDSALLVSLTGLNQVGCAAMLRQSSAFMPLKNDRSNAISSSSTSETVHHSPAYSFPATAQRNQPQRPESFLFRAAVRAETNKGLASPLSSSAPTSDSTDSITRHSSRQREEELELIDQLRKHIEHRLKVSLPCDLGAALTDGVVLCHLANHVRPRSVPSIHVPSPAVPKLTMAKCRRNVENFLEACRKIGVPQDNLCSPSDILQLNLSVKRTVETLLSLGAHSEESSFVSLSIQLLGFEQLCLPLHILEEKGLSQVAVTVQALLELAPPKQQQHQLSAV
ncbi:Leucine-rich repeat and calponin homology domain-containing protein 3 [Galemys pyrenaicus]|uniref:Leucine-rich repeat and calponin homology domain-containing protein 3 n=1 Tax=Galemys pyrenaicus TaxID=202257 RepID=A0A8J6E381_GALPY|nr:Leucine-rich repeat and calponin homology domain-containing protein 3 [Galemys pyrenaicus]